MLACYESLNDDDDDSSEDGRRRSLSRPNTERTHSEGLDRVACRKTDDRLPCQLATMTTPWPLHVMIVYFFFFVPIFGSFVLFFVFFFALRHPLSWQQKCNSGSVPQVDGGSLLKRVQQRKRETDVSRELGKRYVYSLEAREVV